MVIGHCAKDPDSYVFEVVSSRSLKGKDPVKFAPENNRCLAGQQTNLCVPSLSKVPSEAGRALVLLKYVAVTRVT